MQRMLEEASRILRNDSSQAALPPETEPNANNVNASDVFRSARSMLNASSRNGVFRRLNSSERLRSLPYPNRQVRVRSALGRQHQTKDKGEIKVLEFAVLKCAEDEKENMKWDSIVAKKMECYH